MNGPLRVGGGVMKWDDAVHYLQEYTTNASLTWSYPAYDGYPGHPGAELGHADLPAVSLLNAGQQAIVSYYGLAAMLPEINRRLDHPNIDGSLQDADLDTVEAIARLFDVAWEFPKPHVRLTKLAKVLHRKRRICCRSLMSAFVSAIRRSGFRRSQLIGIVHERDSSVLSYQLCSEISSISCLHGKSSPV